jgi:4-amino-4-deoxy-L-arabinose transferase-like glycosyltransferase
LKTVLDIQSNRFRDLLFLTLIGLIAFLPGLAGIPPIDRDESRYVQATVQMVETGDLIDIRFQDQARHKKPAGAYWAQLASLGATGQIDDVKRGERAIWAHRLPSVLGALIAIWATYLCGATLFGRREAFIGAGLLAVSVSLAFEAHLAKTDAMLAGASAVVLYGLASRKAWPTWIGLALGMLLKGPILLGLALLALAIDATWNRSAARLRSIAKPLPILVALMIAVPWFVAIGLETNGAFFAEAIGRDFGGKISGAQEAHGGAPGYYLVSTLFMFWPGILAVPIAAIFAWKQRADHDVRWLIAWLVPMWILLELVPTKLPHYTLILYPALALLAGAGWVRLTDGRKTRIAGLIVAAVIGGLISVGVAATLWTALPPIWVGLIAIGMIALAVSAGVCLLRQQDNRALLFAALFLGIGFGGVIGHSPLIDLSPRLVAKVPDGMRLTSPDYREPSLVFLTDTQTQFTRAAEPGDALILAEGTVAPACATKGETIAGMNYAKGSNISLTVFLTENCSVTELSRWAFEG